MKLRLWTAFAFLCCVGLACAQEEGTEPLPEGDPPAAEGPAPKLETLRDQASYAIGLDIGSGFKSGSVDVDLELVMRGIADGLSGADPLLSEEEIQAAMEKFQEELQMKRDAQTQGLAAEHKAAGATFLAENKRKKGVVTLKSGLQYRILQEGDGPKPKATDMVSTHYRGTLLDGTQFDSSYDRDEPTSFPVNRVIAGWTEALQLMPVGSKWQLFIPSELAYGDRGAGGGDIPPGATLIFEVELLGIEKP